MCRSRGGLETGGNVGTIEYLRDGAFKFLRKFLEIGGNCLLSVHKRTSQDSTISEEKLESYFFINF